MYLIDGQEPMQTLGLALLAHYPNMPRYKEFLKGNNCDCDLHFMPPFELEELMQLQPWVFPAQKRLTQNTVRICTTPGQSQGCAHYISMSHIFRQPAAGA